MKKNCAICGKEIGVMSRKKVLDGFVCMDCAGKATYTVNQLTNLKDGTVEAVKAGIARKAKNAELLASFTPTKKIEKYIYLDEPKRQWIVPQGMFKKTDKSYVHSYDDILEFELLENGGTTVSSGGLGRAVVGGVLFGAAGAVVGGVTGKKTGNTTVTSMQIKITTKDISDPVIYISLINGGSYKTNSFVYKSASKSAQAVLSTLAIIAKHITTEAPSSNNTKDDTVSKLREYKDLLDDGIITKSEFEKKKRELLG